MGSARDRLDRLELENIACAGSSCKLERQSARGLMLDRLCMLLTGGDGGVGNHSSDPNPPPPCRCRRLGFFI